jgi:hypothetical protein
MYEVKREEKALAKYFLSPSAQLAKYTAELGVTAGFRQYTPPFL